MDSADSAHVPVGVRSPSKVTAIRQANPPEPHYTLDLAELDARVGDFRSAFPGADVLYALKANSDKPVLQQLEAARCGFEAASWFEVEALIALGVAAERITYGTAVKPRAHVERAAQAGIDCFAADSAEEIDMLAAAAPGSRVFVRAKLDDRHSVFRMNEKFGALVTQVAPLLRRACAVGLIPWGVSFNVGSQATRSTEWAHGVDCVAPIFRELYAEGIKLEVLNLGGGFPAPYRDYSEIKLSEIAEHVRVALSKFPYQPRIVVEPGRGLVATALRLVSSVVARVEREGQPWLFLDCGIYNALYEALIHQGRTAYPVSVLGSRLTDGPEASFTLAGPTGDGLDVIAREMMLPADVGIGDRLLFENVGAYTRCMASTFNGFPVPALRIVGAQ